MRRDKCILSNCWERLQIGLPAKTVILTRQPKPATRNANSTIKSRQLFPCVVTDQPANSLPASLRLLPLPASRCGRQGCRLNRGLIRANRIRLVWRSDARRSRQTDRCHFVVRRFRDHGKVRSCPGHDARPLALLSRVTRGFRGLSGKSGVFASCQLKTESRRKG